MSDFTNTEWLVFSICVTVDALFVDLCRRSRLTFDVQVTVAHSSIPSSPFPTFDPPSGRQPAPSARVG